MYTEEFLLTSMQYDNIVRSSIYNIEMICQYRVMKKESNYVHWYLSADTEQFIYRKEIEKDDSKSMYHNNPWKYFTSRLQFENLTEYYEWSYIIYFFKNNSCITSNRTHASYLVILTTRVLMFRMIVRMSRSQLCLNIRIDLIVTSVQLYHVN
jgi:hypothetical protein